MAKATVTVKLSITALTGLIFGAIAWLMSAIPVVYINNLARSLAIVGIFLGTIGLLSINKGKRRGKGIAIGAIVVSIVALLMSIFAQIIRNGLVG